SICEDRLCQDGARSASADLGPRPAALVIAGAVPCRRQGLTLGWWPFPDTIRARLILRRKVVSLGLAALILVAASCDASPTPRPSPKPKPTPSSTFEPSLIPAYRAFTTSSYWNIPLPEDAPIDPNSQAIIQFLKRDDATSFPSLPGTRPRDRWR